jgi:hypothetical protein
VYLRRSLKNSAFAGNGLYSNRVFVQQIPPKIVRMGTIRAGRRRIGMWHWAVQWQLLRQICGHRYAR